MKDETIVKLVRTIVGGSFILAYAFTQVDGGVLATGMFLLGVPWELVTKQKEPKEETE